MTIWESLEAADKSLTLFINSFNSPFFDRFWIIVSGKMTWIPLYILILFLFFRKFGWKRTLLFAAIVALTILVTDQLCQAVKYHFQRIRPCNDEWMIANGLHIPLKPKSSFSFFSAHAANNFSLVALIVSVFGRYDKKRHPDFVILWLWATLIAFSRIFVARHFFGDIFVGALAGLVTGYLMSILYVILHKLLLQGKSRN